MCRHVGRQVPHVLRSSFLRVIADGLVRSAILVACIVLLSVQIYVSIIKYRESGTLLSLDWPRFGENGFPLPAITLCTRIAYNESASHKRSDFISDCLISTKPCASDSDEVVHWSAVRELNQVCHTAYPQIRGDRHIKFNGYFFKVHFSEKDQRKGKINVYLHDSTDGEAWAPFFVHGQTNVEVPFGSMVKVELSVRSRHWLDGYQRRCRDNGGYHQRSCLNRCFERAVKRALNYSCGLDWFLEEDTCPDPDQAYTLTKYVNDQDAALLRTTDCGLRCPEACRLNFFHFTPFSRTERAVLRRHRLAVLSLYFRDTCYQLTQERLVYDWFTLFGEVSGALSLLLGVSLTSCLNGAAKAAHGVLRSLRP